MNTTNTPKEIDDSVINFCKSITPYSLPEYIQLRPESWCIPNECYNNVKQKVGKHGGKRQLGWRIQVMPDPYPKFMIEAVHHAIWISETGEKIDITPQPASANRIVFVSDDSTKLGKYRIGEKYHALLSCPIVNEYVRLCNLESTKYLSKTELIKTPNIPSELLMKQRELLGQIIRKHGGK
ncbi:hypothetical protein [Paenibacillus kobensis]|uniref:hypothetical protein n=1 Tax=Paenibacillus kobensis TaxID=59841 RepID=UPI000FD946AE|nr:hypothetical protein [Paenibacillus kobensis]